MAREVNEKPRRKLFLDNLCQMFQILNEDLKTSLFAAKFYLLLYFIQELSLLCFAAINDLRLPSSVFFSFLGLLSFFNPATLAVAINLPMLWEAFVILGFLFNILVVTYFYLFFKKFKILSRTRFSDLKFPLLKNFRWLVKVFVYLLFVPQLQGFMQVLICQFSSIDYVPGFYSPSIICESVNIPLVVITILILPIFLLLSVVHSVFYNSLDYDLSNALAKSYSMFSIYTLLTQLLLIFLYLVPNAFIFLNLIYILMKLLQLLGLTTSHVYYNPRTQHFSFTLNACLLCTSVFFEILKLTSSHFRVFSQVFPNIIFITTIALCTKAAHLFFAKILEQLIKCDVREVNKPSYIDLKIKFIYYIVKTQKLNDNNEISYAQGDLLALYCQSFFTAHAKSCRNPLCLCFTKLEGVYDYSSKFFYIIDKNNKEKNFENIIFLKLFFTSTYAAFIKEKARYDSFLKFNHASFLYYQFNNFHKSIVEMLELVKNSRTLSIFMLILIKRCMQDNERLLYNLNRNYKDVPEMSKVDFITLIRFEKNYTKLRTSIIQIRQKYIEFLNHLLEEFPNLAIVEKKSKQLLKDRIRIDSLFERNSENPLSIKIYLEYRTNFIFNSDNLNYMERLLTNKFEKISVYKKMGKIFFEVELMFNEESIIVHMGTDRTNLGQIIKANSGFAKFVGYSKEELEFSNINILMPTRIAQEHDRFLTNYLETGKGNVLFMERTVFARNRQGYIQFTSILVKPIYDRKSSLFRFIGFLQPFNNTAQFIVTDHYGNIDGMTLGAGNLLRITPHHFESKRTLIQTMCPNLCKYYLSMIYKEEIENQKLETFLTSLDGVHIAASGQKILKFFPYSDGGAERYEKYVDKKAGNFSKKYTAKEKIGHWLNYSKSLENGVMEEETFLMTATFIVLYSSDKTLEMQIICLNDVDPAYQHLVEDRFGRKVTLLRDLEDIVVMIKEERGRYARADSNAGHSSSKSGFLSMKTIKSYVSFKTHRSSGVDAENLAEKEEENDQASNTCKTGDIFGPNDNMNNKEEEPDEDGEGNLIKLPSSDVIPYILYNNMKKLNREVSEVRPSIIERMDKTGSKKTTAYDESNSTKRANGKQSSAKEIAYNPQEDENGDDDDDEDDNKNKSQKEMSKRELQESEWHTFHSNASHFEGNKTHKTDAKKRSKLVFENEGEQEGSVGSSRGRVQSNVEILLGKRFLPNSFRKTFILFFFTIFVILVSQTFSTLILYNNLDKINKSFKIEMLYQEVPEAILRSTNSIMKIYLMATDIFYKNTTASDRNKTLEKIKELVKNDSDQLNHHMVNLQLENPFLIETGSNVLSNQAELSLYTSDSSGYHIITNIHKALIILIKSIHNFIQIDTDKIANETMPLLYYCMNNVISVVENFDKTNSFRDFNMGRVENSKSIVFTLFGVTTAFLLALFLYRVNLYNDCYKYLNYVFRLVGIIPNEELSVLRDYFINVASDLTIEGIETKETKKFKTMAQSHASSNKKLVPNQRRRPKKFKFIIFPLKVILFLNVLWFMIIFLGFASLLIAANLWDQTLENLTNFRNRLNNKDYVAMAKSYLLTLDQIYQQFEGGPSLTGYPSNKIEEIIFQLYNKNSQNDLYFEGHELNDYVFEKMNNRTLCESVQDTLPGEIFYSQSYCDKLLKGILNHGVNSFKLKFYSQLLQFYSLSQAKKSEAILLLDYEEYGEALEYTVFTFDEMEYKFTSYEETRIKDKLNLLILFIFGELVILLFLLIFYWNYLLSPLRKRLLYARKCFIHFPLELLKKQQTIMKHLKETKGGVV